MNTLIGLALAIVIVLGLAIRRSFSKKSGVRQKDRARKEHQKRELEQDRLDCLELARGLDKLLGVKAAHADAGSSADGS